MSEQIEITETKSEMSIADAVDMLEKIVRIKPDLIKINNRGVGKCIVDSLVKRKVPHFDTF